MTDRATVFRDAITTLISWLRCKNYRFVTVTPATHERVIRRFALNKTATLRDAFGWNLPFPRGLLPVEIFQKLCDAELIGPIENLWRSTIRLSSLGRDLFAHAAFPTTEPDAVFFGPDTYRFAAMIERRLSEVTSLRRAVDIGCGTGAGGMQIARFAPDAQVFLTDINERALTFASINAEAAGAQNVKIVRSDILSQLPGQFDFVVANPPYMVDASARAYRHGGDMKGTELSVRILAAALERLNKHGLGLIYTGAPVVGGEDVFRSRVEPILKAARAQWTYEELDPDVFGEELDQPAYADVERIAVVALTFWKD